MLELRRRMMEEVSSSGGTTPPPDGEGTNPDPDEGGTTPIPPSVESFEWNTSCGDIGIKVEVVNRNGSSRILDSEKVKLYSGSTNRIRVTLSNAPSAIYRIHIAYDPSYAPSPNGSYFQFIHGRTMPKMRYNNNTFSGAIEGVGSCSVSRDSADIFLKEDDSFEIKLLDGVAHITGFMVEHMLDALSETWCHTFEKHVLRPDVTQGILAELGGVMLRKGDKAYFTMPYGDQFCLLGVIPPTREKSITYNYVKPNLDYGDPEFNNYYDDYPYGTSQGSHLFRFVDCYAHDGEEIVFTCKGEWAYIQSVVSFGGESENDYLGRIAENLVSYKGYERLEGAIRWSFSVNRRYLDKLESSGYNVSFGAATTVMSLAGKTIHYNPVGVLYGTSSGFYTSPSNNSECVLVHNTDKKHSPSDNYLSADQNSLVFSFKLDGVEKVGPGLREININARAFVMLNYDPSLTYYTEGDTVKTQI